MLLIGALGIGALLLYNKAKAAGGNDVVNTMLANGPFQSLDDQGIVKMIQGSDVMAGGGIPAGGGGGSAFGAANSLTKGGDNPFANIYGALPPIIRNLIEYNAGHNMGSNLYDRPAFLDAVPDSKVSGLPGAYGLPVKGDFVTVNGVPYSVEGGLYYGNKCPSFFSTQAGRAVVEAAQFAGNLPSPGSQVIFGEGGGIDWEAMGW